MIVVNTAPSAAVFEDQWQPRFAPGVLKIATKRRERKFPREEVHD
jgi:hypothetical protein